MLSKDADRRDNPRAAVDLLMNRYLDGQPYMCRAIDISRGGVRLERLIEPDHAPRFMGLQFQLPGGGSVITASGEVVAVADGRWVQVRFTRIADEHAALIEQYARAA